jgi:hypothetical protein
VDWEEHDLVSVEQQERPVSAVTTHSITDPKLTIMRRWKCLEPQNECHVYHVYEGALRM